MKRDVQRGTIVVCLIIATFIGAIIPIHGKAAGFPFVITDDTGQKILIQKRPSRIVSISPNMTEILYAVGGGELLVGISDLCDYPPPVKRKPRVGDLQLRTEAVLSLKPDLVLAHGGMQRGQVRELRRLGINVAAFSPENWNSVLQVIQLTGDLVGRSDSAKKVVRSMEEQRLKVYHRVKEQRQVRVFVEVWNAPLMTAGPGTFLDQLITMAGGCNIVGKDYPQWSAFPQELIIERDPEIIILTCKNKADVLNRRGWQKITAVRLGRVFEVEPDVFSRPGPRLAEALESLSLRLHPVNES